MNDPDAQLHFTLVAAPSARAYQITFSAFCNATHRPSDLSRVVNLLRSGVPTFLLDNSLFNFNLTQPQLGPRRPSSAPILPIATVLSCFVSLQKGKVAPIRTRPHRPGKVKITGALRPVTCTCALSYWQWNYGLSLSCFARFFVLLNTADWKFGSRHTETHKATNSVQRLTNNLAQGHGGSYHQIMTITT